MGSQLSVSAEEETMSASEEPREPVEEPKHKVLFLTEDEAKQPSKVSLEKADEPPPGLILPNGDINWNCHCLGGMAVGPCGLEFREAFSCFHYSKSEVKGSECLEQFAKLQMCMKEYPELYEERQKEEEGAGKPGEGGDESEKDSPAPSEPSTASE